MGLGNTNESWGSVAKWFHWTVALLVGAQLLFGLYLSTLNLYRPEDLKTYVAIIATHKSIGLTVMFLVLLRLGWRLANPRPALPATLTPFEDRVARLSHALLYALLVLLPLLGWAQSSAYRAKTTFWGLFQLPDIVPAAWARPGSRTVWQLAQDGHTLLAVALVVLIALHVAAALRHHFIKRDDVLVGMLPGHRRQGASTVA